MDTIFAQASARGKAGVAVVRLSGPGSWEAVRVLAGRLPEPRVASLCTLSEAGGRLDEALVLTFAEGASFTGEEAAELHLHGGRAVVAAVSEALVAAGARVAEPGEITRRAFLHGKMDLTEAEGIADLIEAETEAQRRQALRQTGGALAREARGWAERLTRLLAQQEAALEFAEEGLPSDLDEVVRAGAGALRAEIAAALADGGRGERLREGLDVAILGAPNVGKSSLLNALTGREAAIVSARAGTTRDVVEARFDLAGVPATLADTAGLREGADEIEAEGIRRARQRAEGADLRLWVRARGVGQAEDPASAFAQVDDLQILNKADLGAAAPDDRLEALSLSTASGQGLSELHDWIAARLARDLSGADFPAVTRERHRRRLVEALAAVEAGRRALDLAPEMAGDDLRRAADALARVTGAIGVEDILGEVFSTFCIGK